MASALELFLLAQSNNAWTTYTPTWTAVNTAPGIGNGVLTGRYLLIGRTCLLWIYIQFGSTTSGGTGEWAFSLPFAASGNESAQVIPSKCTTGAGGFVGAAEILTGSQGVVMPNMPQSASNASVARVRNADSSGAAGTGVPLLSGGYAFTNGMWLLVEGIYEVG